VTEPLPSRRKTTCKRPATVCLAKRAAAARISTPLRRSQPPATAALRCFSL